MKMNYLIVFFSLICLFTSCQNVESSIDEEIEKENKILNLDKNTLAGRFSTPENYKRQGLDSNSYAFYLQHIKLKPEGTKVRYHDGGIKSPYMVYAAVVDYDLGKRDLQQCADAVMRLRAEYLYKQKQYKQIHFNFTNGMQVDYSKWAEGQRVKVNGNKSYWVSVGSKDYSYKSFQKYLDLIYTYAGSASLSKELKPVVFDDLQIGDVFIQGGFPGHAITVMDVAINPSDPNDKLFILSQSYMPAQDIQILLNPNNDYETVWYSTKNVKDKGSLHTPEWAFELKDLKRFKE
jgi:hypothetical protein